jgi:glycosyltransferase involved in cell wall biosynthesis
VLVLDEEVPWPANTGKRLRTLNLLTALARDFSIDFVAHANGATPEAIGEMKRRGIDVYVSPSRIPEKRGLLLPLRVIASIVRGIPYSVHSHHQSAYHRIVRDLVSRHRYELIHCEWTPYAIYASDIELPVCIAAHNVESLIWDRIAENEVRPAHRLLFQLQAKLMRRFERRVFRRFGHSTAVSDGDADAIRALGCRDVVVVPNGVDTDAYRPPPSELAEPHTLVFTGSMDWRANQDAIGWFINRVHPILQKLMPYRFYVVGRTPPDWLKDSAIVPKEIVVTGTVDDVRPWIAQAAVYVVPLRVAGGSRLKILEALAMARAVVATTVGAEGLDLQPRIHLLIADEPGEFAEAIHGLATDPSRRESLGRKGRERVEALYRWERIAPLQSALWKRIVAASGSRSRS